jgi:hypothetical protein
MGSEKQMCEPVTKLEALELVNKCLDARFVDVDVLCELLIWQNKLLLWHLQENGSKQHAPSAKRQ